jgi:methionyl-tRNA synthetase
MRGKDVFYVAGTDENGLKIKEAAEKAGRDPQEFVAEVAGRFQSIFQGLGIRYDAFIRTTQQRHVETSQVFFKKLQDNGYIYKGDYQGWYDVSTETFYREEDLVDGKSPDGNEVRWVHEQNYFFKLTAFQDKLLDAIESNRFRILPDTRRNEVLAFIKQGLRDTCISRQNPGWGIPVPGDESQVIYVWFDALINYVTAAGWPQPGYENIWPAEVQWLGKDILTRFHATLWPAMLMGVGLDIPGTVVGHGWILLTGEKISKSRGNVVAPLDLANDLAARSGCSEEIAIDAVRYQLISTMPFESDGNFSYEDFDLRYNTDLANDLGNALNRSLAMAHKFVGGKVPDAPIESEAAAAIEAAKKGVVDAMADYRLDRMVAATWGLVRFLNKYIDTRAPWALAKNADPALPSVMKSMLVCLRAVEALARPVMPNTADEIASQLGSAPLMRWEQIGDPECLTGGAPLGQPKPVFPRLEIVKGAPKSKEAKPVQEKKEEPKPEEITIEEFQKVVLRVARIVEVDPVEGADKLYKMQIAIGEEKRQIIAGIRKNYEPLDLIGRQIVVVANLKPAVVRGVESRGMLLAAVDAEGGAIILQPEREAPEGAKVR